MNLGAFAANLNAVEEYLSETGLFQSRLYPNYREVDISLIRDKPYLEQYEYYKKNGLHNFSLFDDSLLLFDRYEVPSGGNSYINMHFSFLEAPFQKLSYEDFRASIVGWEELDEETLLDGYEFDLKKQSRHTTPLRYDFQPQLYEREKHSAAHLHVGFNNHIRLATRKCLEPMSFALFVCRNAYPPRWLASMDHRSFPDWKRSLRDNLVDIDNFSVEDESCQLVLK